MYEEPYRWVEAVANRRQYLDDQLTQGNPLIAVSYTQGILLLTVHRGTPKLYEIYDRIALGGMGHPADLEKLRFSLLDLAHVEGFQRSPSDVTASRLTKNGVAPVVKQAFEEIFRAPYIVKILLAEVGKVQEKDRIFTTNYDGLFEERSDVGVLASRKSVEKILHDEWKKHVAPESLKEALERALRLWGLASLLQGAIQDEDGEHTKPSRPSESDVDPIPDEEAIRQRVQETLNRETLECVLLDRTVSTMETYRVLTEAELHPLLPSVFSLPHQS
ncbi:MAG: proteasome subunit alpha [Nitrospirales bacterium]